MIINLSDQVFEKIQLEFLGLRNYSKKYIKYIDEREVTWKKQKLKLGDNLWNGIVYTIEKITIFPSSDLILSLGLCEYKDIIFKSLYGINYLADNYGNNFIFYHVSVIVIIRTKDHKYIFGIVGKDGYFSKNQLSLIGGSLNYDENRITSVQDIKLFAIKELEEETKLKISYEQLKLVFLTFHNNCYQFFFNLQLPINSQELEKISKNGELSSLIALSKQEIEEYQGYSTDDFLFFQKNINSLGII